MGTNKELDDVAILFGDWLKQFRPNITANVGHDNKKLLVYIHKGWKHRGSVPETFSGVEAQTINCPTPRPL